jgi:hypothetical protein
MSSNNRIPNQNDETNQNDQKIQEKTEQTQTPNGIVVYIFFEKTYTKYCCYYFEM